MDETGKRKRPAGLLIPVTGNVRKSVLPAFGFGIYASAAESWEPAESSSVSLVFIMVPRCVQRI